MSRSVSKHLSLLLATLTILPHVGVFSHVHDGGTRTHVHVAPDGSAGFDHDHGHAHDHEGHDEFTPHSHSHPHHDRDSADQALGKPSSGALSVRPAQRLAAHWHAHPPVLVAAIHALPGLDVRLHLADQPERPSTRPHTTPLRLPLARGPPSLPRLA